MYTDEQLEFIDYSGDDSLILSATAGSGKTHSTVGRLKKMLEDGVDPSEIIFFSFTNDAVDELRTRINNADVKITTIHAFTFHMLATLGKFKKVATFYDFIIWYTKTKKPGPRMKGAKKDLYYQNVERLWEETSAISSRISAFKLQLAEGIKTPMPDFYIEYQTFLNDEKKRDFGDMLIEAEKLSMTKEWKDLYVGKYKYVFVDEYQDTSTIQMRVLLNLQAEQYHLIGDQNQAIYGFSGTSCSMVEKLLTDKYDVKRLTLSINFRSKNNIVENSNKYSSIVAIANDTDNGVVNDRVLVEEEFWMKVEDDEPLTVLVRTNKVIKKLEKSGLLRKIPMRYNNYLSKSDIEKIRKGDAHIGIMKKVRAVLYRFGNNIDTLLEFIEEHAEADTYITTIHKSKGREYPRCVIVNSFDPEMLDELPVILTRKEREFYTYVDHHGNIDREGMNVHYVAITRPMRELHFLYIRQ